MAEAINEQSVSTFDNLSCKTEKELGDKMYEETETILLVWGYESEALVQQKKKDI